MPVTSDVEARLVGESLATASIGSLGVTIEGTFGYTKTATAYAARNVIAIIRGGDPALRDQYVAIGAHTDQEGFARRPLAPARPAGSGATLFRRDPEMRNSRRVPRARQSSSRSSINSAFLRPAPRFDST